MTAHVLHPTLTDWARELRAMAAHVHNEAIDADVARDIACRNWIAATLPRPDVTWQDFADAMGILLDLEAGILPPSEVGVVCGIDRQAIAIDVARDDVAEALHGLLFGPGSRPCTSCRRSSRDVWRPAVDGGLCGPCADVAWIGGRA